VVMPPVERQRSDPTEARLHADAYQLVLNGVEKAPEVALGPPFAQVIGYRAPLTACCGPVLPGPLTDLAPMLLLAGNVDLLRRCSYGEGGLLLRAGGRRHFWRGPLGRVQHLDPWV
jgi:hypothetical protein